MSRLERFALVSTSLRPVRTTGEFCTTVPRVFQRHGTDETVLSQDGLDDFAADVCQAGAYAPE